VCGFAGAGVLMTVAESYGSKARIGRSCRCRYASRADEGTAGCQAVDDRRMSQDERTAPQRRARSSARPVSPPEVLPGGPLRELKQLLHP
jgi:hypothetical protein